MSQECLSMCTQVQSARDSVNSAQNRNLRALSNATICCYIAETMSELFLRLKEQGVKRGRNKSQFCGFFFHRCEGLIRFAKLRASFVEV